MIVQTDITFTKQDNADFNLATNQDRITEDVWITRKESQGIFNIRQQSGFSLNSPAGTLWAFGKATNVAGLTFQPWRETNGGSPPSLLYRPVVLLIPSVCGMYNIFFTSWTRGDRQQNTGGGGFSYTRSSQPVDAVCCFDSPKLWG